MKHKGVYQYTSVYIYIRIPVNGISNNLINFGHMGVHTVIFSSTFKILV